MDQLGREENEAFNVATGTNDESCIFERRILNGMDTSCGNSVTALILVMYPSLTVTSEPT